MSEERVREYWRRVWTDGDVGFAREFYAPVFHLGEVDVTAEAFARGAAAFRAHFPDLRVEVLRLIPCAGGVVSRVRYEGHYTGEPYDGLAPNGLPFEATGLDVFLFDGGRVVEHLHEADHESLWEQLGVPIPG